MRIDAHHHLWRYTEEEYGWINDEMQILCRDFLLPELHQATQTANVELTIAVQARQTVEETSWLLQCAESDPLIAGVVGWLPIAEDSFPALLEKFASEPHFRGLRHVVQGEAPGFLSRPEFNRGIERLRNTGLTYDILIYARQLPETIRFVDRHPDQGFVLDHIAKPDIRGGEIEVWAQSIRELAKREHVCCKISGMVTEADPQHWKQEDLKPYFDVVLEAFGPSRLMVGTDWPVLTVGCSYTQWWETLADWMAPLSAAEKKQIESDTAARMYRLDQAVLAQPSSRPEEVQA